jgi:hypothetical protein
MPLRSIADAAEWKSKHWTLNDAVSKVGESGSPDPAPAIIFPDPSLDSPSIDSTQAPLLQKDFATALGVSEPTISRFVRFKEMPVRSIAEALEWHSKYLSMTLNDSVSEVGESGSLHQPPTPVAAA